MPPSAMIGTPAGPATVDASKIAVICGTPTPLMIRVVQIDPGPIPSFTASAPHRLILATPQPGSISPHGAPAAFLSAPDFSTRTSSPVLAGTANAATVLQ